MNSEWRSAGGSYGEVDITVWRRAPFLKAGGLGIGGLDLEFPTCQKIRSEISYQQFSTELRVLSTELPERDTLLPHPLHPQKRGQAAFPSRNNKQRKINRRFTRIFADD